MSATRTGNPTSVVLVDHRNVVSEGVRALLDLEAALEVLAGPSEPANALTLDVEPDVVVANIDAESDGPELVVQLHAAFPNAPIVVLTLVDDPRAVRAVLAAGASGYVLKSANPSELMEAVETVASGGNYLQAGLGVAVARQHSEERHDADASLSANEAEIVRLIARGFTNAEIASQRGVSLRTIETQRANVLRHLGLRTRADLVRYAYEHGLAERGS